MNRELSETDLVQAEQLWRLGADRALLPCDLMNELDYWLREHALLRVGGEPRAEEGIAYAELRIAELTGLAEREAQARELPGYPATRHPEDLSARFAMAKFVDLPSLAEMLSGRPLNRRGDAWWLPCPFHRDDSPSLKIYPSPRGWYCFGCRRGGDAVSFVSQFKRMTAVESLLFIEQIAERGEVAA